MLMQNNFRQNSPIAAASARDSAVSAVVSQARPSAVTLYPANATIYAQGEAGGHLYLVEFGAVRICHLTADGRRQIGAFHFAGEVFGFESGKEHQCYAESVDGAGIRVLRPTSNEGLADRVLSLALKSLARTQNHLLVLGRMSASEKMAAFLIDLCERQDTDHIIGLPMQRNDIADYLGITFETVSRVLRVFKESRVIRLHSVKQIEILNFVALEDLRG